MIEKFFLIGEESDKRYAICESCDSLNSSKICGECGCYMPFKVRLAWLDCPLKKWDTSDKIDYDAPINPDTQDNSSKEEIIIVP